MHNFTKTSLAALAAAFLVTGASAEEFSYTETFDESGVTGNYGDLPEGWLSTCNVENYKTYLGSYLGSGAHSGDYVAATMTSTEYGRNDYLFTKGLQLKGGVTYTVSYWVKMPGMYGSTYYGNRLVLKAGTEQTKDACTTTVGETGSTYTLVSDWTEQSYTFTPEADGTYYFAFNHTTQLSPTGYVAIDDFTVTGDEGGGGGSVDPDPDPDPTPGATETLWTEDFDDDSHFTASTTVPDGWTSTGTYPLARHEGSYFGGNNYSGDYVFGTASASSSFNRDEAFYTKTTTMKAGQEYTLSFYLKAPGGASSMYYTNVITAVGKEQGAAQTAMTKLGDTGKALLSDWTQQTYTFTPAEDGDYTFGIFLDTQLWNSGFVLFDDFELVGPAEETPDPDTDPDPNPGTPDEDKIVKELPYSQSFDNENEDYDGTTYVPDGWLATGSAPFVTANISDLAAKDGTYYLIAPESSVSRDDRLYTPFFNMTAGTEYNVSFYLYMPGDSYYGTASDLYFTVGTEQDSEFHTDTLLTKTAYTNTGWELVTVKFTPAADDLYCFSFVLGGEQINAGEVCLDLFKVTSPGLIAKPKAKFAVSGYYNIMDSKIALVKGASLKLVSTSTDAATYSWTVDGVTTEPLTEANPTVAITESGDYKVTLTVTNIKGESTASRTLHIACIDSVESAGLGTYSGNESPMSRDNTPCYSTHEYADWVLGVNHYYKKFAERYALPEGNEYEITSATVYLCWYGLCSRYYSQEAAKPVKIVIYGEKDNRPDLDNVYGTYETTMSGLFGTTGLSKAEMRGLPFSTPVVANGPFYVAFEFADDLWISETDGNLSRTVVGLSGFYHETGETSFYVCPDSVPANATCTADGQYYPVDQIDSEYKGLGLTLVTWMNVNRDHTADAIAVAPNGSVVFATRLIDDQLNVSGTTEGETVTVYSAAGQVVARTTATGQSATLSLAGAPAGVYLVKTAAGTQKFNKK